MSNSEQVRSQLGILRENIDKVDAELLQLLNQRAELVLKVGELKKANNLAVIHADREKSCWQGYVSKIWAIAAGNGGPTIPADYRYLEATSALSRNL